MGPSRMWNYYDSGIIIGKQVRSCFLSGSLSVIAGVRIPLVPNHFQHAVAWVQILPGRENDDTS